MLDFSTIIILTSIVIFLSILSSIAGLGGGVFLIPLIILFFNLPIKYIAGTMLLAMLPYTAIATFQNIRNRYVHFRIGLIVQIGAVI
ncbi:MAG: TSUP family transporter, partial [Aliifodinibius sp.]|nr:TSUP family transporter [Fodinibius sp.]